MSDLSTFPFSFIYNGVKYSGFGEENFRLVSKKVFPARNGETTEFVLEKDETLNVTLKCTHYPSHGVSEWTVWFENQSDKDSGIIEKPESCLQFVGARPTLKGILGDHMNKYRPYTVELSSNSVRYESNSGRATHIYFPYFNLEYGDEGVMLAIGWAGTWTADFRTVGDVTTYKARSVNNMKTKLKPGDKVRTALFVCAPYSKRNEHYATNFWRSWFVECNLPPFDSTGKALEPFSTCNLSSDTGLLQSDGSISERYTTWRPSLEKMIAEDVKVDVRWFDAGWYERPDGGSAEAFVEGKDWWDTVGTWKLDPAKWPGITFRESTDFARANGMRTMVWFEPERVTDVDSLVKNHGYRKEWAIQQEGVRAISNNIGDPDCFRWTVDRITTMLRENRVEIYREDNNSNQSALWKLLDEREGEDRKGITECKFIDAHYRMWDEFIACTLSFGGCGFVDSCASGGGRNDLESMRRGVPLLRSDADRTGTGLRLSMTTSFNRWIPFCGALTKEKIGELDLTGISDPYVWRASYLASLNVDSQFVQDPDQDFDILRFGLKEWKKVNPYLRKELYVLTPWHTGDETSGQTAFCYYDSEKREGILLAFRQEQCTEAYLNITLPIAGEGENYLLKDEDTGEEYSVSGKNMAENGLDIYFENPRTARLLWVKITDED